MTNKAQTKAESNKERDIKIYEAKVKVYSGFSSKLWKLIENDKITQNEMVDLRTYYFEKMAFYLNDNQLITILINNIAEIANCVKDNGTITTAEKERMKQLVSNISINLMKSLTGNKYENINEINNQHQSFYNSFIGDISDKNQFITKELENENINFWHFNILGDDEQLQAFEKNNWILNLIEYGEDWRTKTLKRVEDGDIVFLYRRGGYGYVGAFIVEGKHITDIKSKKGSFSNEDRKYDIYNAIDDGASLVSSLIVRPLAFTWEGVEYKTVRRRTIEIMYSGYDWLLEKFTDSQIEKKEQFNKLSNRNDIIANEDKELLKKIVNQYKKTPKE